MIRLAACFIFLLLFATSALALYQGDYKEYEKKVEAQQKQAIDYDKRLGLDTSANDIEEDRFVFPDIPAPSAIVKDKKQKQKVMEETSLRQQKRKREQKEREEKALKQLRKEFHEIQTQKLVKEVETAKKDNFFIIKVLILLGCLGVFIAAAKNKIFPVD